MTTGIPHPPPHDGTMSSEAPRLHAVYRSTRDSELRRRSVGKAWLHSSLAMVRDPAAMAQLQMIFAREYLPGEDFLNLPPDSYGLRHPAPFDPGRLGSDDLLLAATRPPLSDDPGYERRAIERSGGALETYLLRSQARFFEVVRREMVILSPEVQAFVPETPERATWPGDGPPTGATFRTRRWGPHPPYELLRAGRAQKATEVEQLKRFEGAATLAYVTLHRLFDLPDGRRGPLALTAFGIDSTSTLLFSAWLRRHRAEPLRRMVRDGMPRILVFKLEIDLDPLILPSALADVPVRGVEAVIDVTLPEAVSGEHQKRAIRLAAVGLGGNPFADGTQPRRDSPADVSRSAVRRRARRKPRKSTDPGRLPPRLLHG